MKSPSTPKPRTVTPEKWLTARRALLREEKKFLRLRDQISQRRRALPRVKVATPYVFTATRGAVSLADLFAGRTQLIVYHFMLGPGWEEGCRGCSFVSDHFDGALAHLQARDVAFAAVSSAPLAEILAFKRRMGWQFEWVSSHGTSFNHDFHVSFTPEEIARGQAFYNFAPRAVPGDEMPGLSVFAREGRAVYHTYSTYSRGLDPLVGTYQLLDLVPKGRNENPETPMDWVRHHDRYARRPARR